MIPFEKTRLQTFSFGDNPDDIYYFLINLNMRPDGMNPDKIRLADPRNFDQILQENGCILMMDGNEVNELIRRGELDQQNLHNGLYELAKTEGIIK
jgi:hypothetical protein